MLNSAENVVKILFALNENVKLGLNEISRVTEINKSTVFKILKTLEFYKLIEQEEITQKYKLGISILQLSGTVLKELDLRTVARPVMNELAKKHEHTLTLAIRSGSFLTFIDRVDGKDNVRFYCDIGKVTPFNGGAAAKAYLANLPKEEVDKIVSENNFKKITSKTLTEAELLKELESIREKGYSISDEEVDLGVLAIGVPIFGHEGKVIASMAIAGLKQLISEDEIKELIESMLKASAEISNNMGYKLKKVN